MLATLVLAGAVVVHHAMPMDGLHSAGTMICLTVLTVAGVTLLIAPALQRVRRRSLRLAVPRLALPRLSGALLHQARAGPPRYLQLSVLRR